MYRSSGWWAASVVVAILFAQVGCEKSPVQHFKAKQGSTMTPNGKIKLASVKEVGDKIEYQTEDGKRWRVGYSKRADGTYEYQTPDAVK